MEFFGSDTLFFLFFIALFAGFIDTLAGGGGLITIPALLLSGLSPLTALGTNKFQAFVGTGTATFILLKKRKILWQNIKNLMLMAFVGSVGGSLLIQFISVESLSFIIPLVLVFIAVFFIISPKPKSKIPQISQSKYQNFVVPIIGCYDGMFGPGTGSFFTMSGMGLRAYDLLKATFTAKPLNFATNIASMIIFISLDKVAFKFGLVMMIGQIIGAWFGVHSLQKIKSIYLRIIIVVVSVTMLAKYLHSVL